MLSRIRLATGLALAAFGTPAWAHGSAAPPIVAVTGHTGSFNGHRIGYTATVAEHYLTDDKGAPLATATTIAYVRNGARDLANRPVLFCFNGGPGASSSPTHMALGPIARLGEVPGERASGRLVPNETSPLDAVDLVFIDPPGTGFSRALPGVDASALYTSSGDARAVADVIRDWLRANHRESSPKYLLGESYGTIRAALIAATAKDLKFDGVLLVALPGQVGGSEMGREMPYVTSLPTMAVGAWYHNRIERAGRSPEQVYNEAVRFARTDYVIALIQGSSLPAKEKRRIAERMSSLIGLPADLIEQNDLRISKPVFMFNLLKDKGLRTGLLDVRVTAPLEPGQEGSLDDPALGVAPKHVPGPGAPPLTPASIGPVPSPLVGDYIVRDLKFPTSRTYYGVNFSVNAAWKFDIKDDVYVGLGQAMKADPHMRLFWAAGYFDLTTPAYASRYTLDQDGIPPDRLTAVYFAGPHSVYEGEANLAAFDGAVRRFVAEPRRTTAAER